jgi:ATP-dependent helicase YprA (DUF1998 family)/very-short-patch-repair endonuclease
MDIFNLRNSLVKDYASYISSFIKIRNPAIKNYVNQQLDDGLLWPDPLIQLNPSFKQGEQIDGLVSEGVLHETCRRVFKIKPDTDSTGKPLRLHQHQEEAVRIARGGDNYILTTGTGSGKSLAYIIPIVDSILRRGSGKGIQAIIVYPMNALANSQLGELKKFLQHGFPNQKGAVTFERYTGQESDEDKKRIMANPPDILLTNYVMLELILTRPDERETLVRAAQGLKFFVLDELHTYRGRQGSDVALLVRRVRNALSGENLQCIGTSATLAGGEGTYHEQQAEVAQVATKIFGAEVKPEHVIGETLRRATPEGSINESSFREVLKKRIQNTAIKPSGDYAEFLNDPLSTWIENTFGVTKEIGSDRLIRATPSSITGERGAAQKLSKSLELPLARCEEAIMEGLLAGYDVNDPETEMPLFAFRLHQFISRGDTVYTSIETGEKRHITVHGQKFVPGNRDKILLPLVFCRECGQEYFSVFNADDKETSKHIFTPRTLQDTKDNEVFGEAGYLYFSKDNPWTQDIEEEMGRLPDDWLEEHRGEMRVRPARRKNLPQHFRLTPAGEESAEGSDCHFISTPFRFCLNCGVSYDFRQRSDFAKLTALGTGGRSTATTILGLSAIRGLYAEGSLPKKARKMLSFTDNRQDAALQAGHFNDFIEISILRAALYRAIQGAGTEGVAHDHLTQKVFETLNLPLNMYASDPDARFQKKNDTEKALRDVLGYRLYYDLRRGWRVTSPNLEQSGLLEIQYPWLEEVSQAEDIWEKSHPAIATAKPETRVKIAKVLLDYMRRELATKVDYLNTFEQERIQQRSSQHLAYPWAIDENEQMEYAAKLYPRSKKKYDYGGDLFVSSRGGFGQYLRNPATFDEYAEKPNLEETQQIIQDLLTGLRAAGLVEIIEEADGEDEVHGYQLPAAAMLWVAGDGTKAFHDPIRVSRLPEGGGRTNPFFVKFYKDIAGELHGLRAREHTAQVPYADREKREELFRAGELPVLFCSPTMELGIDISQLNVVNMRNVPPTPANYAQRSGRAGRSGQPALVFTYSSVRSPHDQYFFKKPERMVAGAVTPPRLDLSNDDLLRAHLHAIWLAETGLKLGTSLKDILDLSGEEPTLELLDFVQDAIQSKRAKKRAQERGEQILSTLMSDLKDSGWYKDDWLESVFQQVERNFEDACQRWRDLYRAARKQESLQRDIELDASRTSRERIQAKRLRREAVSQLELLTDSRNLSQSDFYSYRYFASEGFLPGYNFPRLPLSAYIPARRVKTGQDEFLSRPRFLAISEFGPRAFVYHEGSRYLINRVIMPVAQVEEDEDLLTTRAKMCPSCGYLHPIKAGDGLDQCEKCENPLQDELRSLFRLQNVATKRRDKINSDEEERTRMGYEIRTGIRFTEHQGQTMVRTAIIQKDGEVLARLSYGNAATLWRINLGWRRRANKDQHGFVLDTERGYWAKNETMEDDPEDPMSARTRRVIPFVEDRRNSLLFEPAEELDEEQIASLTAALKNAIQIMYQLEGSELAAEPLPSRDERRLILLYEASEGGAGVLRRLVYDSKAFGEVARQALSICHFDPDTGEDLHRAERAQEDCEAACYDCLMSYYNQMDHQILDRQTIRDLLLSYASADVETSPVASSRSEHLQGLRNLCQSDLELKWLEHLETKKYRLPSKSQHLLKDCNTRPDFLYEKEQVAIYVDGYHHLDKERQRRDSLNTECLDNLGYIVLRFSILDEWEKLFAENTYLFGKAS